MHSYVSKLTYINIIDLWLKNKILIKTLVWVRVYNVTGEYVVYDPCGTIPNWLNVQQQKMAQ